MTTWGADLLIPYGADASGRVRHVDDVPRGQACGLRYPSCRVPLVARKGTVKRHHLAHQSRAQACEGWLHATAKALLAQRIAPTHSPLTSRCPSSGGVNAHRYAGRHSRTAPTCSARAS